MSKITDIRDALETLVAASFTGFKKIPNPYLIERNANVFIDKGYGIAIGPAERVNLELCRMAFNRFFNIPIIHVIGTQNDIDHREAAEQTLLEALQTFRLKLERDDNTLGGNAIKSDYEGDSGIEVIIAQDSTAPRYYLLSLSVSVLYQESIV